MPGESSARAYEARLERGREAWAVWTSSRNLGIAVGVIVGLVVLYQVIRRAVRNAIRAEREAGKPIPASPGSEPPVASGTTRTAPARRRP